LSPYAPRTHYRVAIDARLTSLPSEKFICGADHPDMLRRVLVIVAVAAAFGVSAVSGAATPPTPPCPSVEGWTFTGTFGPIDKSISVEFQCGYSLPGQPQQLTLDVDWVKPGTRDVDVDFNQCNRASSGGTYYRDVWSGKAFVRLEYIVNAGTSEGNAAVFAAERERIERSALVFLGATERLAKPCAKQAAPASTDTRRPSVRVAPASGKAGAPVAFDFSVRDNSAAVDVLLTIYDSRSKSKVAFRKDYGKAKPGRYTVKIRPRAAGVHLWCITATDSAGNAATACSKLVIR
jgi:hypothetical protein